MAKALFDYDFSRRVLLDTNQTLNAALIDNSLARLALEFLRRSGTPVYVPYEAQSEAALVAFRKASSPQTYAVARMALEGLLRSGSVTHLPASSTRFLSGINRADAPIVAAARDIDAILITDDIRLIDECRRLGLPAVQPWEVARSYQGPGKLPALLTVSRFLQPKLPQTYLFARAEPGSWASAQIEQEFLLADVGGELRMGFCGASQAWFFEVAGVGRASLPMPLGSEHYVVRGQLSVIGGQTTLSLGAAKAGGTPKECRLSFPTSPNFRGTVGLSIGHSSDRDRHWGGYIRDLVVADGVVSPKAFKLMAASEDLSPNPADHDRLQEVLDGIALMQPPANLGA